MRKLAYRDRFVWELIQTMTGGAGAAPPVQFEAGVATPVLVEWTAEQWLRIFSALMTGADLTYPNEAHQVVWDLLQFIEYPIEIETPGMLQIDLFSLNALPLAGVGTLTYSANTNYPFGYNILTQDIALYGMTQPVWLKAGEYAYTGWHSKTTLCGNTSVAITDAGGIVDTIIPAFNQNGLANVRYQVTGSFTIPADGLYNLVVGNVSPVSGNEQCSWISHHIRQTS